MPRKVCFLFLLFLCVSFLGCRHTPPAPSTKSGDSVEFRLQCLESSLMEMQRQQERDRQYIAALQARLKARGHTPTRHTPAPPVQASPRPVPQKSVTAPAPAAKQKPKPKKPAAQKTRSRQKSVQNADSAYTRAMALLRQGKLTRAREQLQTLLAAHPHTPHKPGALFAIGQSYFQEGVFDSAILAYKDVAGNFPSHPKAPEAMLQIGRCYQQLDDPSNARFYLQALVDEYPASAAAGQAKRMIARLPARPGSVP